ncbi:formylglycine-generating enzyme family protein [Pimelobacter simplex]|uniref:Formylglycine-generating enzyme family protein n=1 Tax=Nocardioides simplex TaxID=2045 RepID=A0A7J5E037_NOCSI|nr:SUMF1/EgtB/PvdO family nonheme iron enzyme [Pimelobacter simplex]KAB2811538.1 formylglycine-generating enzyme family protein [Pimelobacter simplex]
MTGVPTLLDAMVRIPAGVVRMGTRIEDVDTVIAADRPLALPREWYLKECPRHEVFVEEFSLSRTQVSVGQWRSYAAATARSVTRWEGRHPAVPVHDVSWEEAEAFCAWLSELTARELRLPTEHEWERAAKGDDVRTYPWGDVFDRARCNLAEAGVGDYLPVGSLPDGASPFGVLDLAGNGDEWTSTIYRPYPGAPAGVPEVDPSSNDPHVTRGGSFRHQRDLARCSRRHALYGDEHGATFRVATSAAL